jgi:hypothetical protein
MIVPQRTRAVLPRSLAAVELGRHLLAYDAEHA